MSDVVVTGAYTSGTNHFQNAGSPDDKARQAGYDNGPYAHMSSDIMQRLTAMLKPTITNA